ncbi:MAG: MarR family winged helix-turn-helix transcriptional regulator [Dermatophilaceae bacterium]
MPNDAPGPPRSSPSPSLALLTMGRLVERQVAAALDDVGLTVRGLGALSHLTGDPGITFTELARRAGVTVQTMHATVARLVELKAVRSATGGGRGRSAALEVTPSGQELLARARELTDRLDEELFGAAAGDAAAHLGAVATALLDSSRRRAAASP